MPLELNLDGLPGPTHHFGGLGFSCGVLGLLGAIGLVFVVGCAFLSMAGFWIQQVRTRKRDTYTNNRTHRLNLSR